MLEIHKKSTIIDNDGRTSLLLFVEFWTIQAWKTILYLFFVHAHLHGSERSFEEKIIAFAIKKKPLLCLKFIAILPKNCILYLICKLNLNFDSKYNLSKITRFDFDTKCKVIFIYRLKFKTNTYRVRDIVSPEFVFFCQRPLLILSWHCSILQWIQIAKKCARSFW